MTQKNNLDKPIPRSLVIAAVTVPLIMFLLLSGALLLPHPMQENETILSHIMHQILPAIK